MKKLFTIAFAGLSLAFTGCETPHFSFDPSPEQIEAFSDILQAAAQIYASTRNDNVYRVALCYGIYEGSVYGTCDGADTDALRDAEIMQAAGFDNVLISLNGEVTRRHIIESSYLACANLKAGDLLYIKASSHGGDTPDTSGDEPGGKDQFFCCADGPLLDDDIWRLLCQLPEGVRVILAVDTCHSGSMYRAPHDYGAAVKARLRNAGRTGETFKGSLIYIGACADDTVAYGDTQDGGQLSYAMAYAIPKASTTDHWLDLIKANMPPDQVPVITKVGGPDFGYLPLFH